MYGFVSRSENMKHNPINLSERVNDIPGCLFLWNPVVYKGASASVIFGTALRQTTDC